jgi:hypothetical protein
MGAEFFHEGGQTSIAMPIFASNNFANPFKTDRKIKKSYIITIF